MRGLLRPDSSLLQGTRREAGQGQELGDLREALAIERKRYESSDGSKRAQLFAMERSVGIVLKGLSRLGVEHDEVPQLGHLRLSLDRLLLGHRDEVVAPLTSGGRGTDPRAREYVRAAVVLASILYKAGGAGQGEADKLAAKIAIAHGLVEHIAPKTVCRWRLAHEKQDSGAIHAQRLLELLAEMSMQVMFAGKMRASEIAEIMIKHVSTLAGVAETPRRKEK